MHLNLVFVETISGHVFLVFRFTPDDMYFDTCGFSDENDGASRVGSDFLDALST
jgi:hypothetical protein